MQFGRRTEDPSAGEGSGATLNLGDWLVPGLITLVALVGAAIAWSYASDDHKSSFERAAAKFGVTDALRADLRQQFQKTLVEMDRDICDETLRDRAGKAAVAYYETLIEKPVTEAGLEVTYDSRCQSRPDRNRHPFEQLFMQRGLGSNLTLPWDCMPSHWRTPLDRALQAKLEQMIISGRLTSESLSGTLAIISRPTKLSAIPGMCRRASSDTARRNLPLINAPTDDWDRGRRRR